MSNGGRHREDGRRRGDGVGGGWRAGGLLAAVRSLRAFLFGVTPADPLSLALAAALVGAVAVFAMLPPIHRAIRLDPVAALGSP